MITYHTKILGEVTGPKWELHVTGWVPGCTADTELRVVAALGGVNTDWGAYCGPAAMMDTGAVLANGTKLSPEEAARIFPVLDIKRYRK